MNDLLQLLWDNNTAAGRTIILIIVALGTCGSACAVWHRHRYHVSESRCLDAVRRRLQRARDAQEASSSEEVDQPASAAGAAIELHELLETIPSDSLVGDRLRTIARMKQARAKVNVDALQQSSLLKESARWTLSFPSYVISLVMMLGLLGTFIGLSLMIADIQQAIPSGTGHADAAQWAASVASLGKILAGKKTAFSATLAGIFSSIVVSALNFALARAQADFYDRLERFTTEDLLPAVLPAFDDETPWEKLSLQLGDSFEHLKELTTEQTKSAAQILAIERTFGTIIGNIESITRAATAPLEGMTGEITNVIAQIANVNAAVIAVTEKLPQIVNAFRQGQQSAIEEIRSVTHQQQVSIERLIHAIENTRGGRLGLQLAAGAIVLLLAFLALHHNG